MTTYELLQEAILGRRQVRALYHGLPRAFCPHVLGAKGGEPHCVGYQFEGESRTRTITPGSPGNWRCFVVAELSEIALSDGPWYTAPNWDRRQSCVDEIEIEVKEIGGGELS